MHPFKQLSTPNYIPLSVHSPLQNLTSACFVASYLALPFVTRMLALAVCSGTGISTTLLVEVIFELKLALT